MSEASFDLKDRWWKEVTRPGGQRHICEEEVAAQSWGLLRRVSAAQWVNHRLLEGGRFAGSDWGGRERAERVSRNAPTLPLADVDRVVWEFVPIAFLRSVSP